MDNNQLDKIERHTRVTKEATKVIAELLVYSAVAGLVGGLLAAITMLFGGSLEIGLLTGVVVGGIAQIFVVLRAFLDVREIKEEPYSGPKFSKDFKSKW